MTQTPKQPPTLDNPPVKTPAEVVEGALRALGVAGCLAVVKHGNSYSIVDFGIHVIEQNGLVKMLEIQAERKLYEQMNPVRLPTAAVPTGPKAAEEPPKKAAKGKGV